MNYPKFIQWVVWSFGLFQHSNQIFKYSPWNHTQWIKEYFKCLSLWLSLCFIHSLVNHKPHMTSAEVSVACSYFTLICGPTSHFTSILTSGFGSQLPFLLQLLKKIISHLWFSILVQDRGYGWTRLRSFTGRFTLGSWPSLKPTGDTVSAVIRHKKPPRCEGHLHFKDRTTLAHVTRGGSDSQKRDGTNI